METYHKKRNNLTLIIPLSSIYETRVNFFKQVHLYLDVCVCLNEVIIFLSGYKDSLI